MKFNTVIFSLAACGYSAQAQEESGDNRFLWQQTNMLTEVLNSVFPETMDGWKYLLKYGCYCHQAELKLTGSRNGYHGPALDELDSLCRDAFRAQNCLQDDYSVEFSKDDNSRGYPFYIDENNNNEIVCNNKQYPKWETRQENQFRRNNCLIEKEFVENVVALIQNGYQQNADYIKLNNFKYNQVCPVSAVVPPANNNECCGVGLTRKPFNNAVKQCCSDEIVDLGSC